MAKVITNTYEFAQAIQRQFGCDREILEQLVERFSENVVIAGDRFAVAHQITEIAGFGDPKLVIEDPNIDWDELIDEYADTDQAEVGYTYDSLEEAIPKFYTKEECQEIARRNV